MAGRVPHSNCVLQSVLARNALQVAQQSSWQSEWQAEGLASGLDEAAYKSKKRSVVKDMVAAKVRSSCCPTTLPVLSLPACDPAQGSAL